MWTRIHPLVREQPQKPRLQRGDKGISLPGEAGSDPVREARGRAEIKKGEM